MTQDCLNSPSTADVSKRLPKGIHVIGAERLSDPSVEGISQRKRIRQKEDPSTNPTSWSYIFILHMAAKGMEKCRGHKTKRIFKREPENGGRT